MHLILFCVNIIRYSTLHVIELNSSVFNRDVLIHLRQLSEESSSSEVVQQNLILVLKCHVTVEWVIESSGIEGSLHVVVSSEIFIL